MALCLPHRVDELSGAFWGEDEVVAGKVCGIRTRGSRRKPNVKSSHSSHLGIIEKKVLFYRMFCLLCDSPRVLSALEAPIQIPSTLHVHYTPLIFWPYFMIIIIATIIFVL